MSWHEGTCEIDSCGRETRVIHVDGYGDCCIVCIDALAETGEVEA